MKPIVVDLEMSGLQIDKCGICQIGAIDLETKEEFFDECRIDDEDQMIEEPSASKSIFEVLGMTEEELRDPNKQSQKELLEKFFNWLKTRKMKNLVCTNPTWDVGFLWTKAKKYGLEIPFNHRSFDTHSIAHTKYFELNKKFLTEDKDYSEMGLKNTLKFCGMEDNRDTHNALGDAKLTAECFSRLIFGEKLLDEYLEYEIPEELKK
jgi:DNA polymerase-3 subunit epsilon